MTPPLPTLGQGMQNNLKHQGYEEYIWGFSVTKIVYKCIFLFGQREGIEGQKYVDSKNKIQCVSINTSQAPTLWQVLRILK